MRLRLSSLTCHRAHLLSTTFRRRNSISWKIVPCPAVDTVTETRHGLLPELIRQNGSTSAAMQLALYPLSLRSSQRLIGDGERMLTALWSWNLPHLANPLSGFRQRVNGHSGVEQEQGQYEAGPGEQHRQLQRFRANGTSGKLATTWRTVMFSILCLSSDWRKWSKNDDIGVANEPSTCVSI